ncbi:MAG: ABC transporter substrate-binding protein [Dehalococcoidia bacterium]|nr:ABC transporter substrate-binding protein [Dehalococcoidia bacterium]
MSDFSPGPKTLVLPVRNTMVSYDSDTPRLGGAALPAPPYHVAFNLYEPLAIPTIRLDPDNQRRADFTAMQGRLAERWEHADDFRVWTLTLRRGVRSVHGNELTADDVKWSWDRAYALRGVGLWRSRIAGGLPQSSGVEVVDRYTVRFTLPGPKPSWPKYWAFATNAILDTTETRKHATVDDPWAVEFLNDTPAGHGPYAVVHRDHHEMRFVARDDYYRGRPGVTAIKHLTASSREEAIRMFEQGEVNFIAGLYPAEFLRLSQLPGVKTVVSKTNHSKIELDWKSPPLDDIRVRHAISYAIPYDRILREAYLGFARPNRSPVLDIADGHDDSFWPYHTDVEKARALLREAGIDGLTLPLHLDSHPESRAIASIVQEALASIGITVTLEPLDGLAYGQMVPMWLKAETSHGIADAHYDIAHEFDPPRGMHGNRFIRDRELVSQLRAIHELPSSATISERYRALQKEIVELAPAIFLAKLCFLIVYRDELDPWLTSGEYVAFQNMLWASARSMLPGASE